MTSAITSETSTEREASKPGRTHRAMREQMQARLIHATADVLVERGYAQTSVQAICSRVGVTKGALFRHYDRRSDLLAATAHHIFEILIHRFGERFAKLVPGNDFAARTIELLREHMADPFMQAAHELETAARTDDVLRESLAPVLSTYLQSAKQMARFLFPNAKLHNPDFDAVVDIFLGALSDEATTENVLQNAPLNAPSAAPIECSQRKARLAFLARLADTEILVHEPHLIGREIEQS